MVPDSDLAIDARGVVKAFGRTRAVDGASLEVDEAIALHQPLEAFLAQAKDEATSLADEYRRLEGILTGLETEK